MTTAAAPPEETLSEQGAPGAAPPPWWLRALRWTAEANVAVVSFCAIVFGLFVGAILIVVTTPATLTAWGQIGSAPGHSLSVIFSTLGNAFGALFTGSIFSPSAVGHAISTGQGWAAAFTPISETMVSATPLILAGTGVAIGFSTGVFNIGGQGQLIAGAIAATYVGFGVHLPLVPHLVLVVLAGAAGGAVAGFIPGILKARTGAHEVIVTIMLNYIFLNLLNYLLVTPPLQQPGQSNAISRTVPASARLPHLFGGGLRVNVGFLVALGVAAAAAWFMKRGTLGFEFKVIGANPSAGRTAGMDASKATILVLTISGALVGLAGMSTLSGTDFFLSSGYGGNNGFNAITVALLGRNRPLGVVLGSLLFAALSTGGRYLQANTNIPLDLTQVIQAVIVFLVATPALVREIFRLREAGAGKILLFTKGWGA
ncbi:MAG: ABC transporter permease [Actinomycetota bacterium]|nr:ABC transporter permease [Actinomycetota bacterium]